MDGAVQPVERASETQREREKGRKRTDVDRCAKVAWGEEEERNRRGKPRPRAASWLITKRNLNEHRGNVLK